MTLYEFKQRADVKFLRKRLSEQITYIVEVKTSNRTEWRKRELIESAREVMKIKYLELYDLHKKLVAS